MIGKRIRFFRKQKNLTIAALAELADIGEDTLSNIELNKQKPHSRSIQKIARALEINPQQLTASKIKYNTFIFDTAEWKKETSELLSRLLTGSQTIPNQYVDRIVHQWLVTPAPQTIEIQAGRRIGKNLVSKVQRRVIQIRHMDDFVGGRDLLMLVNREVCLTGNLLHNAAYSDSIGKLLFKAIAELCQLAGWIASDAGDNANACRYYRIGIEVAHLTGDRALAANLISSLAYHLTNNKNNNDGILLAQSALYGVGDNAAPCVTTLLRERVAWAQACAGHCRQAELMLAQVETGYSEFSAAKDPDWVYWLNEDEIDVMAARCFVQLHQPQRAIELLSNVLKRYDPGMLREVALYTSWLSEAHILAQNIEEATHYATRTAELAMLTNSARSDERLRLLVTKLKSFASVPAVKNFMALNNDIKYPTTTLK